MNSLKNSKLVLATIVLFLSATYVYSYPPDNAAVLYYKAAVLYEIDDAMSDALADLQDGEIEVDDTIREFVKKNRSIINTLLDAAEVKNCDWGMDLSDVFEMNMPPLGSLKRLTFLIAADARMSLLDGNYEDSISHCVSLYKMAHHINDRNFISYLVGISVNTVANNCIIQIMSDMPQDMESMSRLKNHLLEIDSIPFSIKSALWGERETMLMYMTPEGIPDIARLCECEEVLLLDNAMIERNKKYFENYYSGVIRAFDMPYIEGYALLEDLAEKMNEDIGQDPAATITHVLVPAVRKMLSLSVRLQTYNNAIKTAIELYLVKAQTGEFPNELPVGLPKDLFSGEDFKYEKADDGFILRCQGKDLGRDKIFEYKFEVKQ